MDFKTINTFPIREYLAGLNIHPAKDRGYYGMYHSPFRKDSDASMKVDYNKNLWIDYGANEGGTLIDLVMRIENCSNGEAIRSLEQRISGTPSFSFHGNNNSNRKEVEQESAIKITGITPLNSPALINYIRKRCVNLDIASEHCKEVHYLANDKPYYAIGFQNGVGGWALRNEHFKGCIMSMGATFFDAGSKESCQLYEGFMDFLSYLTMKGSKTPQEDSIVLNSTVNLAKVKNQLSTYPKIYAFLDNDEAGKQAVQNLRSVCKEVIDQSVHYANHKDLNDYLCSRSAPKQIVIKKPGKGLRM